jgi:GT2 family glycosyltransferase
MKSKFPNIVVSIIVVNYNQSRVTAQLLESIQKSSFKNLEVIVVNNGCTEANPMPFKEFYPWVIEINSKENLGFAGGNNLGLKYAIGDYLFFLNNDTELPFDCIGKLIETLHNDNSLAGVSPKLIYHETKNVIQYAGYNKLNTYTMQCIARGKGEIDTNQYNKTEYTNFLHGAAMMLKRSVIDKVGLMDDRYFLYYEELDWIYRIKKQGYKIAYVANAVVYHKESISTGKNSPLKTYYLTRNRILFARKNFHFGKLVVFYLFFLVVALPKGLADNIRSKKHMAAFLKGIFWNISNKKNLNKKGTKHTYYGNYFNAA